MKGLCWVLFPPLSEVWVLVLNASRAPSPPALPPPLHTHAYTHTIHTYQLRSYQLRSYQFKIITIEILPSSSSSPSTFSFNLTLHTELHFKSIFCEFVLSALEPTQQKPFNSSTLQPFKPSTAATLQPVNPSTAAKTSNNTQQRPFNPSTLQPFDLSTFQQQQPFNP